MTVTTRSKDKNVLPSWHFPTLEGSEQCGSQEAFPQPEDKQRTFSHQNLTYCGTNTATSIIEHGGIEGAFS